MTEIIIGVVVVVVIIFLMMPGSSQDSVIQRRLEDLKDVDKQRKDLDSGEIFRSSAKNDDSQKTNLLDVIKDTSDYRIQFIGEIINKVKFVEQVKYNLKIADMKMPVDLFFMMILAILLPFVILGMLTNNIFLLILGLIASVAPFIVIKMKFEKRKETFTQQFPEALGIISNSLRAGHSLLSAFQTVASESEYPMNKLFKTVSDEISLGREVRETLIGMSDSIPGSQDLKFFVTAVLIQREVGGNLSEILDNLNNTIRERYKLFGLIKTQTAQAQLSGIVLGLAPVFISVIVNMLNPKYMAPLFTEPMGMAALALSFIMSLTGFLIIKKVTQIRV